MILSKLPESMTQNSWIFIGRQASAVLLNADKWRKRKRPAWTVLLQTLWHDVQGGFFNLKKQRRYRRRNSGSILQNCEEYEKSARKRDGTSHISARLRQK